MNTLEKIRALVDEFTKTEPGELDSSTRNIVELVNLGRGLGLDPLDYLMPQSEAEADQQVDNLIALLFQVRGDDLPPFDLERHMLEATATDEG
jgi:hypothetical protein